MTDTTINGTESMAAENTAAAEQQEAAEIKEAQKKGVVDMSAKKKEKAGNYTHTFAAPVEIGGQKVKALTFYFEKLTGADIEAIEEELQDQNRYVLSPEISSAFQSMLAAKAAGVGSDEIRNLPVGDYMKIKNKARAFLLNMG